MRIEYDPNLVEQAVFLAVRGDRKLERELHAATDSLFALAAGRTREAAFRDAYAMVFRRLGLDQIIPTLITEPILGGRIEEGVGRCLVREAARTRDESAELLVRPVNDTPTALDCSLVVQLCPGSLLDHERVKHCLRRELLHVADMLDPRFGYQRESLEGGSPERNLVRDRYRVLWDIHVESRLKRCGRDGLDLLPKLWPLFTRAFTRAGAVPPRTSFDRVMTSSSLNHSQLLAWATDPDALCLSR